jgi:hypothetical protein
MSLAENKISIGARNKQERQFYYYYYYYYFDMYAQGERKMVGGFKPIIPVS